MLRVLKCRLYPTFAQSRRLSDYIDASRNQFNRALEQRIYGCKSSGKSFSLYDQYGQLTLQRAVDPVMSGIPVDVQRDGLRRVDSAFKHFFRRCKEGAKKKGFPRFKSASRYNSFTVTSPGKCVRDGRIQVIGIKTLIRCRGLQLSPYVPKRLTIVRRAGKWFTRILVDDGKVAPLKVPIETAVGIDVGLSAFLTTSDGEKIECPKHYRRLERRLRRAQRRVSRCRRGSNRRKKALRCVQAVHAKIADCRGDFTHKLSKSLVSKHDLIVAENLNIKGMVQSRFGKSILDAAWGQFLFRVSYKAESAGRTYLEEKTAYSSQECSECGEIVPKTLNERMHRCPCGCVLDRDENAARVMLDRGLRTLSINLPTPRPGSGRVMHAEAMTSTADQTDLLQVAPQNRAGRS